MTVPSFKKTHQDSWILELMDIQYIPKNPPEFPTLPMVALLWADGCPINRYTHQLILE